MDDTLSNKATGDGIRRGMSWLGTMMAGSGMDSIVHHENTWSSRCGSCRANWIGAPMNPIVRVISFIQSLISIKSFVTNRVNRLMFRCRGTQSAVIHTIRRQSC